MHIEIIYSKWLFFLFSKIPKKTKRDPIQNWGSAISHLMIKFEARVNLS
ncbi:hypothetical protein [Spiroplasma endosymbiont of Clivina fossor]